MHVPGSRRYADPASFLLTPQQREPQRLEALGAGKHVLCENPLTADIGTADELIQAADAAGRTLLVVDNQARDPAYREIVRLVGEGTIGRVAVAEVHREADLGAEFRARRRDFLAPGGGICCCPAPSTMSARCDGCSVKSPT